MSVTNNFLPDVSGILASEETNHQNEYLVDIYNVTDIDSKEVVDILKNIYDPEIYYSIYDMGLIYKILIENEKIHIIMTLTSINCPEAQSLPQQVKDNLKEKFNDKEIIVEIVFEPTWTVDNMSDEIKLKMGLL